MMPRTETQIVMAERGASKVVITLYGVVTPERLECEKRIALHRAEQLAK